MLVTLNFNECDSYGCFFFTFFLDPQNDEPFICEVHEFVKRLLFKCHVLEDLDVEQCLDDNVSIFTVKVPSLKSASLSKSSDRHIDDDDGFVIDAPSLELLNVCTRSGGFCTIENNMANIVKAYVVVNHSPKEILSATISVKRLIFMFTILKVHLTICTSDIEWINLLMCILRDSPNLKALKLKLYCIRDQAQRSCWNEPSSVPECLSSSLETFEWVDYEGTKEEKQVAVFILRSYVLALRVKSHGDGDDLYFYPATTLEETFN
ncbi:unnamed protein product [Eruca vesicaria subsp. sativa]|uniref:FBD domain-containing protein n=1 Tax=Eruca vesicaria subsp. sativa TaxID=29727 RepID=A0ABC8KB15_ERUVS|nr:unnamed protein product [Eruca vesicaria subsp. sativa]